MSHPALRAAIAQKIAVNPQGRITFADFMETALYHPQHGYYATKAVNLGSSGDFFTSVHLSADFGELLAEQFVQMWEILGRPVDFSLVEMGAGQGVLAVDILKYLAREYPDFFASLNYIIIEKSAALRKLQQRLEGLKVQ
ncbi:MAG: SAM-dependent methyltransferase, partial [Nostocaceae cyanobacterium]|nr:SAM-dependent methyltransferase [Nostocaceae cyanobacterium]